MEVCPRLSVHCLLLACYLRNNLDKCEQFYKLDKPSKQNLAREGGRVECLSVK